MSAWADARLLRGPVRTHRALHTNLQLHETSLFGRHHCQTSVEGDQPESTSTLKCSGNRRNSVTELTASVGRVQSVVLPGGEQTWTVLGGDFLPAAPVEEFLEHRRVIGSSPKTVKSYARGVGLWWRYLAGSGVAWDEPRIATATGFISWLREGMLLTRRKTSHSPHLDLPNRQQHQQGDSRTRPKPLQPNGVLLVDPSVSSSGNRGGFRPVASSRFGCGEGWA
jgi:hypothetical protein